MTHHRRPLSTQAARVTEHRSPARRGAVLYGLKALHGLKALDGLKAPTQLWTIAAIVLVAAPAHAAGKLVLMPDPMILGALLVFFVLLIIPLNAMIFRPLLRVLDDRDRKIAGASNDAQQLVTKAQELMDEYRGKIREAREDAEAGRRQRLESARSEQASITGDAKSEAEVEIGRAREEINQSLNEARATIEAASREVASVAAERILGRPIR